MTTPRVLVLDLDGTLLDSFPHLLSAFREAVRPFVFRPPTDEEIVATFGPAERGCLERLLRNSELAPHDAASHLDEAHRAFLRLYQEGLRRQVRLFPGVEEMLQCAEQCGWHLAVFTGKGRSSTMLTLEQFGLLPRLGLVVTSDDVPRHKPAPDGILVILRHFQIHPCQALVVGDAAADVEAGRAAACRTGAALWGTFSRRSLLASRPDYLLHQPGDLIPLLRNWPH
ncbi:MAG: HAD family hydrolase [Gemmatales bacterium]|nr:HAD family hydrolase [Gemmatales bacterium]MDW8222245.1 HAD family hydrolase [Gemmatales bacterium]